MTLKVSPIDSFEQIIDALEELLRSEDKAFCVAINPEKIYRAQYDQRVRDLLNQADVFLCDGVGTALAVRILHRRRIRRITGVALFFKLIEAAADREWPVFLLGAHPDVNEAASKKLQEDYPQLKIVGRQDGYFSDSDEVVAAINDSRAQLVFVAMGSPTQEAWITANRENIFAPFCMGVGGTFDVVSGNVKWAPKIFRKTGTEWLYRLLKEPTRWRRQLALPRFLWLLFRYKAGLERN